MEAVAGRGREGERNELLLPREPCRAGTSNTGFSRASKQDLSVLTGHEEYRFQYSIQFPSKRFSIPRLLLVVCSFPLAFSFRATKLARGWKNTSRDRDVSFESIEKEKKNDRERIEGRDRSVGDD